MGYYMKQSRAQWTRNNWRLAWRMARCPDSYLANNDTRVPCGVAMLFAAVECLKSRDVA